jgi:hypothetical protein
LSRSLLRLRRQGRAPISARRSSRRYVDTIKRKGLIMNLTFTDFVAFYAAFLSSIVFFWTIKNSKLRFKVRLIHGGDEIDGELISGIYVFIQNPSGHKVHLEQIDIVYPYKKSSFYETLRTIFKFHRFPSRYNWCHTFFSNYALDSGCPVTIEPGQAHRVLIPQKVVDQISNQSVVPILRASGQDSLWRSKFSKRFKTKF